MAFGIQTESGGGNFTPTVKINAKQGRVYRVDRNQVDGRWETDDVEITGIFQFVPDLANVEVGWMYFAAAQAPDLRMVKLGQPLPERPPGVDDKGVSRYKQGIRLLVKLGSACGGDLREISATAKSILGPLDKLHTDYVNNLKDHPGQLPVVKMTGMTKIDTKTAHGTNTNFEPVFEVVKWVDRDSVFGDQPAAEAPPPKEDPKPEPKPELTTAGAEF